MAVQILGTSHIAEESIKKVEQVISEWKPDVVAVELDHARLHALYQEQRKVPLSAIGQLGLYGYLFQMLGGSLQRKLGKLVNQKPGADMKAAVDAARNIGAQIALIDRPIEVTLQKLKRLSIWEKLKLIGFLLRAFIPIGGKIEMDLKKVPESATLEDLVAILKNEFPGLYKILVTERDAVLARNIQKLADSLPDKKILVVIGAGHLKGVKKLLATGQ